MQITKHLILAVLLVILFLSLKYCVMLTLLNPSSCRIGICKFATLCHQPSQLFVIRNMNFSDPLNFSFIKRRFHPSPVSNTLRTETTKRSQAATFSRQICVMHICYMWPLVVAKPFYFVKANPEYPDFLIHILLI